ncbi:MAG: DUF4445 domain-containing protein [Anaerolineae bacterium]|nr:DUF4445 domain-containing protein [Anaerolineae bacterium]
MHHRLILMPSGRQGEVADGATLLDAARQLGVELEAICGGRQTCGKCLVALEQGQFLKHSITSTADHLTPPGENERAYAAAHGLNLETWRMACAACISGDVLLHIPETSLARKQVILKAARDMVIEVAPAVRLVYVEVEPASLGGAGDWQRLQKALAEQWQLDGMEIDVSLLRRLQAALRAGGWKVTITLWDERQVIRVEPGYVESLYGLAVDVGSTTIVCHLCDLLTGQVIATEAMMNPQVRYGEDLMSRVSYATGEAGGLGRLHHAAVKAVNDLADRAAGTAGIDTAAITDIILVGNTIMHHLLLGIDPVELGQVPFALATEAAVDLRARELGLNVLHPGAQAHLLPCIAGYVGADCVAALLASLPFPQDEVLLILDIGTNAEIMLVAGSRILVTSSPTGPAFEGAQIRHGQRAAFGAIERFRLDGTSGTARYRVIGDERWSDQLQPGHSLTPTGICGSGIIEIVAELFSAGYVAPSGYFPPTGNHPRIRAAGKSTEFVLAEADETSGSREIVVTQFDIRAVQLAKAALYAGARLLMDHLGVERVDRIHLAGAFGSYIDPVYAMTIGMIPDCDLSRVIAVGNAAGDGARLALLNAAARRQAAELARRAEFVETAAHPRFQDLFVEAMALPHASDSFPHLADLKP